MFNLKRALSALGAVALTTLSLTVTAGPANAAYNCGSLSVAPIHSDTFYIDQATGVKFDAQYLGYSVTNHGASAVSSHSVKLNSFTGGTVTLASSETDTHALSSIAAGATGYVYFLAKSSATDNDNNATNISVSVLDGTTSLCTVTNTLAKVADVLSTNASTISTVTVSPNTATVSAGADVTVTVVGDSGTIGNGENNDPESIMLSPVTISSTFDASHYRLKSVNYVATSGTCSLPDKLRNINLGNLCNGGYTATYVYETLATADQSIASSIQGESYIASGANIKHPDALPVTLPKVQAARTITYNANGGTGTMADTTGFSSLEVSVHTFTRECYIFNGWNTKDDATGTEWLEGATYAGPGTLELFAEWITDPNCDPTPTPDPTTDPTDDPTTDPTSDPTSDPSVDPTDDPTVDPTQIAYATGALASTGSSFGIGAGITGSILGIFGVALLRRKSKNN